MRCFFQPDDAQIVFVSAFFNRLPFSDEPQLALLDEPSWIFAFLLAVEHDTVFKSIFGLVTIIKLLRKATAFCATDAAVWMIFSISFVWAEQAKLDAEMSGTRSK
jgi:hypothetical protein